MEKTHRSVGLRVSSAGPSSVPVRLMIISLLLGLLIFPAFGFSVTANNGSDSDEDNGDEDEGFWERPYSFALLLIFVGIIILLIEPFIPGLFLAIPGTVLIAIGAVGLISPDLMFTPISLVIGAVVGILTMFIAIRIYKYLSPNRPPTTTSADSLIGREGIITVPTNPDHRTKGKVRIGSQIWSAYSETVISEGAKVKVIASEGVHVKVRRIPDKRRVVRKDPDVE